MPSEIEPITFELILRGTVLMLLPFLYAFARDREFRFTSAGYDKPDDFHAHLRLMRKVEGDYFDLGQVRLQALPDDRVQIYFSSESVGPPKEIDLDNEEFGQFCEGLFAEFIRLGFIIPPSKEKPSIGFLKGDET